MPFIYHQIPQNMNGTVLKPLNDLRTLEPELYALAVAKYRDHPSRTGIPNRAISALNCTWGDVLQFCPVHPHMIADAMAATGVKPQNLDFYRIPIGLVSHLPAAMYFGMDREPIYERIRWQYYEELLEIPETTMNWYQELANRKLTGAIYNGIPHVMVRGEVNVKDCEIVSMRSKVIRNSRVRPNE